MRKPRLCAAVSTALSLLFLLPLLSGCGAERRYSREFYGLFDTVITVTAADASPASFDRRCGALYEELSAYHRLTDAYHTYDGVVNLKTLNDTAAAGPVEVDERLFGLLSFGKEAYRLTEGRVNICMGSVLALWHEKREEGLADPASASLPEEPALKEAARHISPDALVLDETAKTVFYADALLKVDLGAVAKGYAADAAAAFAKENGWSSAVLSLGGNVIAWGAPPGGGLWRVGVENPDPAADQLLETLSLTDRTVVTSGDYQRYYTVNGKNYCHIIDPDSLYPPAYCRAVTVVDKSSARADALSTALFLLPVEAGEELLSRIEDAEALWVLPDGGVRATAGMEPFLGG